MRLSHTSIRSHTMPSNYASSWWHDHDSWQQSPMTSWVPPNFGIWICVQGAPAVHTDSLGCYPPAGGRQLWTGLCGDVM